jgi:hypothetical protein
MSTNGEFDAEWWEAWDKLNEDTIQEDYERRQREESDGD